MAVRFPGSFTPDIGELRRVLSYNPVTGMLAWKIARRPRTRPGDEAGTVLPSGYVVVTYKGRRYLGHQLAWALHHNEWPGDRIVFVSVRDLRDPPGEPGKFEELRIRARSDLRMRNLELGSDMLAADPRASARREYRERRAVEGRPLYSPPHKLRLFDATDRDERVRFSDAHRCWVFAVKYPNIAERVVAECTTREEAGKVAAEYDRNVAMIAAHPPITDLPHQTPGLPPGLLRELNEWLAYDPETGRMAWREIIDDQREILAREYSMAELAELKTRGEKPETMIMYSVVINGGLSAVERLKTSPAPYVRFKGRRISAARLAWALTHDGDYPPRKGVRFRNNDFTDLRLANLERVHDPLETNN